MEENQASAGRGANGETADEGVVISATRLFAELGYDAVSSEMIADAAGADLATLIDRHGGKRALYVVVMQRISDQWVEQMRSVAVEPGADSLIRLIDLYLDHCLEHPETPRLWMHRWMSDASDITGVDEQFSAPVVRETLEFMRQVVGPHIDAEAAMWSFAWSIHGYLVSGFSGDSGQRFPADDPETLSRFREYLHQLIRLIAL